MVGRRRPAVDGRRRINSPRPARPRGMLGNYMDSSRIAVFSRPTFLYNNLWPTLFWMGMHHATDAHSHAPVLVPSLALRTYIAPDEPGSKTETRKKRKQVCESCALVGCVARRSQKCNYTGRVGLQCSITEKDECRTYLYRLLCNLR
jgi:hypothetical protein